MDIKLKKIACDVIDDRKDDLNEISQKIWSNPELNYEEYAAHELLTTFLQNEGFEVHKCYPINTSFIAKFGCKEKNSLKIGVLCEYDALPVIGHACGHNLIAEAGIGTVIALKEVILKSPEIRAEVIVYGTPAEEGGGGKVKLIDNGDFNESDICMMSHPAPYDTHSPAWLACENMAVVFHGKASHAAAAPWEGINALDAAVVCYNSVSMLRQQTKPTNRIHGIIINGGDKPNVIPEKTEMNYCIRGILDSDVKELKEKFIACVKGAAESTGCTVQISTFGPYYSALKTNKVMIDLYVQNAKSLGINFDDTSGKMVASTDMGNVSQIKPSIHPLFCISTKGPNHTHDFAEASGSAENQFPTLNSAKCMAMTAVDIICDPELLKKIKEDFLKI